MFQTPIRMRQNEFTIDQCIWILQLWKKSAIISLQLGASRRIVLRAIQIARYEHSNSNVLARRLKSIQTNNFKRNVFWHESCLQNLDSSLKEIGMLTDWVLCNGVRTSNRYVCEPVVSTCIWPHRLAMTSCWYDMEPKFRLLSSHLSEILWEMLEPMIEKFGDTLLLRSGFFSRVLAFTLMRYTMQVQHWLTASVLLTVWRYRIQWPGGPNLIQRSCYSGHKRLHCLIYLSLSTHACIICPLEGRRHNTTVFRKSNWEGILVQYLYVNSRHFYLHCDSAYHIKPWMQTTFVWAALSEEQHRYNTAMRSVRIAVANWLKEVKQFWSSHNFPRRLKVPLAPIGLLYHRSTFYKVWGFVAMVAVKYLDEFK